jgi:hypothetical protein
VCRAVELAADNGIITRSNRYANPGKYVTRAEALAMMMKAGGMNGSLSESETSSSYDTPYIFDDANEWQSDIIKKSLIRNIIAPYTYNQSVKDPGMYDYMVHVAFYPNRLATRAEVFAFAKNIIENSSIQSYEGFTADF